MPSSPRTRRSRRDSPPSTTPCLTQNRPWGGAAQPLLSRVPTARRSNAGKARPGPFSASFAPCRADVRALLGTGWWTGYVPEWSGQPPLSRLLAFLASVLPTVETAPWQIHRHLGHRSRTVPTVSLIDAVEC